MGKFDETGSSLNFFYRRRVLVILGILNILEGFHVIFQRIPAVILQYNINYILHCIVHFVIGLFLLCFFVNAFYRKKYFIFFLWTAGFMFIGYGILILATRQNAVKFGYQIRYPFHAGYYFIVGLLFLPILYRMISNRSSYSTSSV
jgi:hypothetical protein